MLKRVFCFSFTYLYSLAQARAKSLTNPTYKSYLYSEETKKKIAVGVRNGWKRRQKMLRIQENCLFEWQNLIAEASREGYDGQAELQWDSYKVLNVKLQEEWLESIERRKNTPRLQGSKRAPKSLEQRRKISEAISRKWADTVSDNYIFLVSFKSKVFNNSHLYDEGGSCLYKWYLEHQDIHIFNRRFMGTQHVT